MSNLIDVTGKFQTIIRRAYQDEKKESHVRIFASNHPLGLIDENQKTETLG